VKCQVIPVDGRIVDHGIDGPQNPKHCVGYTHHVIHVSHVQLVSFADAVRSDLPGFFHQLPDMFVIRAVIVNATS